MNKWKREYQICDELQAVVDRHGDLPQKVLYELSREELRRIINHCEDPWERMKFTAIVVSYWTCRGVLPRRPAAGQEETIGGLHRWVKLN